MTFLVFLFLLGLLILGFMYFFWRSNERPEGAFIPWLTLVLKKIPEGIGQRFNPGPGSAIRSRDLPEAPPRTSGEHEELSVKSNQRDEEIAQLKKLFEES